VASKTIKASVGAGAANWKDDVKTVQALLNQAHVSWGGPVVKLTVDGSCGSKTIASILRFQQHHFSRWFVPDSRVQPNGNTLFRLNQVAQHAEPPGLPFHVETPNVMRLAGPQGICWALAATMLVSAHDRRCYEVETVLRRADMRADPSAPYLERFRRGEGLLPEETPAFTHACGFATEPRANYPIRHWLALLLAHGALGVVGAFPMNHIKVMVGMRGDGTKFGTFALFHDTDGSRYEDLFIDVLEGYEGLGGNPWIDQLAQLWYCTRRAWGVGH
jgi:hypothetical protein